MTYNIQWVYPALRKPLRFWNIASSITFVCVGVFSKIIIRLLNRPSIYNHNVITHALDARPRGTPLITVSNHDSCFDDPGLWGTLKWRHLLSRRVMRWSLAAHDICFTNKFHSLFFMLGKCIPVIRGNGVYQQAIDFCIEQLAHGQWVHVFPEGKVNMTKEHLRFKWGVGRMAYESPVTPIIIPIWHVGMEQILPNTPPYFIKFGKKVTLNFGEPIDLSSTINELKKMKTPELEARKIITDKIQDTMMALRAETERLHQINVGGDGSKSKDDS